MLCDEHTLTLPRSGDKLILHTDASMLGLGAVLSVERKGEELPVAYFSKRLTAAEKNYSASELECLAVLKAVDHYAIHLLGQEFTVSTDHWALTALRDSHKLNSRLMRGHWSYRHTSCHKGPSRKSSSERGWFIAAELARG